MKNTILKLATLALMLSFGLPASGQFRRTSDGAKYPYTTNLLGSDVFIIGRVGETNYNLSSSNLFSQSQTPWLSDINGALFSLTNVARLDNGSNALSTVGKFSHAEGGRTRAAGVFSHSEGFGTAANASGSHAEGNGNTINSPAIYGHVEGESNVVNGRSAHGSGLNTRAAGDYSITTGIEAIAGAYASQAHGQGTALGEYSYIWVGTNTGSSSERLYTNDVYGRFQVEAPTGGIVLNGQVYGNAIGMSNALDLIPGSNITIGTNANGRAWTISSTASGSGGSGDSASGSFTNSSVITISESGDATPYPSSIVVSGIDGTIVSMSVSINGFSHSVPSDVVLVLVGPDGQQIKLMDGCGSDSLAPPAYANMVFTTSATEFVPEATITNGTYRPTSRDGTAAGTPANGPYSTNLSVFNGTIPNGSWGLYATDVVSLDGGWITNWSLTFNGSAAFTNEIFSYNLSASTLVGATSVTLDRPAAFPAGTAGRVYVGWGTTNAEIRSVSTVSSATASFNISLARAHTAGERVVWNDQGEVYPTAFKTSPGIGNNSGYEMLKGMNEAGNAGVIYNGAGSAISGGVPLVIPNSTRLRNIQINANSLTPQGNTNAYLLGSRQGARNAFTASASTDVITVPAGWLPPGSPSNAVVVFYDMGAGTLPSPLTNGIPYYAVTSSATALTIKANVADSTRINLTTDGSGFMDSEAYSLVKVHIEDVYVNGQIYTNIGGVQMNVQQQSHINNLRIGNVRLGLRLYGQQAHFANLEIGPCEVGIDMRAAAGDGQGALFMYFFTLNIEAWSQSALILGGINNHIIGLHMEGGTSETEPVIDGTREASHIVIDNWTLGSFSKTNDIFRMGTPTVDGIKPSYDIRAGTVTAATVDNGMLVLNDQRRGHKIKIYTTTNDASGTGTRHIGRFFAPPIPDAELTPSMYGGESWLAQGGAVFTGPQQQIYEPFLYARAGTNQQGAIFQAVRSDFTFRSGFGTNGDLIAPLIIVWDSSTNGITLSYPYTASSYVMTSDVGVTGIIGNMAGFPSSGTFSLTNSVGTNCTLRTHASIISYGGAITNNSFVIPPGRKGKVAFDFETGTNWAATLQP